MLEVQQPIKEVNYNQRAMTITDKLYQTESEDLENDGGYGIYY